MPVIRAADAAVHELHGTRFTSYAAPARGSTELCVWRVDIPAGTPAVPHRISREEVFVVVAGTVELTVDGRTDTLVPGEVAVVPAGSSLRLDNPGPGQASAWVSTSVGLQGVLPDGSTVVPPWVR